MSNSDKIFTTSGLKSLFSHLKPSSKFVMCSSRSWGRNILNKLFQELDSLGYLKPENLFYVELIDRVPEEEFNKIYNRLYESKES